MRWFALALAVAFAFAFVSISPVAADAQAQPSDPASTTAPVQPAPGADQAASADKAVTVTSPPAAKRVCAWSDDTGTRVRRKVCRDVPLGQPDSAVTRDERSRILEDLERANRPPPLPSGAG